MGLQLDVPNVGNKSSRDSSLQLIFIRHYRHFICMTKVVKDVVDACANNVYPRYLEVLVPKKRMQGQIKKRQENRLEQKKKI